MTSSTPISTNGAAGSRRHEGNFASSSQTRLSASSLVRAYIDSLPSRITYRDELRSFQFWKSLRTELLASFLFTVFANGALDTLESTHAIPNTSSTISLAFGLCVATLIQCTGHVSGCHLTLSTTVSLLVSGRVSILRLLSYTLMHLIGSICGTTLLWALFGTVPDLSPALKIVKDTHGGASRLFGIELLFVFIVTLTYLANVDERRTDLGFKSLSIGLAATVGHLFAFQTSRAVLSPARALASNLFNQTWCLHWIYWAAAIFGGFAAGIVYEYIGSVKPIISSKSHSMTFEQPDESSFSASSPFSLPSSGESYSLKHNFTTLPPTMSSIASSNTIPLTNSSQSIATIASFHNNNNGHSSTYQQHGHQPLLSATTPTQLPCPPTTSTSISSLHRVVTEM